MRIKLLSLTIIGTISLSGAFAQAPFPANVTVGISKPGMNSAAKNYIIYTTADASNGTYAQGVSFTPTHDINGIGLNQTDHLVYGAAYVGNDNTENNLHGVSLKRIGSDGIMVDLGLIPVTGQTGVEFPNFSAGTVGTDNTYYYTTMGLKPSGMNKLAVAQASSTQPDLNASDIRLFFCWINNLSGRTVNAGASMGAVTGFYELDFSNASVTEAINAFLVQVNNNYPDIYNADGGIQDIAVSPLNNRVYGYISYPQGTNTVGRPVIMGPPVNGVTTITPVGGTVNAIPGQEVSGVTFDQAGNFYGLFTSGHYAKINLSSGVLENVVMSGFATSNGNLRGDLGSSFTSTPLALDLISFTGKNKKDINELTWTTRGNKNSNSYEIERSMDSKNWNTIGNVQATIEIGRNAAGQTYYFTDRTPERGTNFYRLRQHETDGSFNYSPTISIAADTKAKISSYPNPVKNELTISGLEQGSAVIMFDITGKVLTSHISTDADMVISLSALPANIYMIQVSEKGKTVYTERIIKR